MSNISAFFTRFYFLTYTVTTTGFGELPHVFTEAQRMWGMVSLYCGVIAWFYALGSIVGLVQNADFQLALDERRFTRRVSRIQEPFCIICGFGNTGALLTRGLSDAGMTTIVVDWQRDRIKRLQLRDYRCEVLGLCADARVPEHLIEAGLSMPNCRAIVALTQDEELNLKIAVSARLLNEHVQIITQSTSSVHEETLATLGSDIHIIDPFHTFARYVGATVHSPVVHTINQWLSGTPGASLDQSFDPPKGTWLICGFGLMGSRIAELLHGEGVDTVAIEPEPPADSKPGPNLIVGRASRENLLEAGIEKAVGIVVTTPSDTENLNIVLQARKLNPDIFITVRQNRYRNALLFKAANVDLVMMPSLVSARRILFFLIAPMLKAFFERLHDDSRHEVTVRQIVARLKEHVGGTQPRVWTVNTAELATPAFANVSNRPLTVTLRDISRDPADRQQLLPCVPLVLHHGEETQVMPDLSTPVTMGDSILLCGNSKTQRLIDATLNNEYTLAYLVTGIDEPRSWAMQYLRRITATAP